MKLQDAKQEAMDELNPPILSIPGIICRMGSIILAEIGDFPL